MLADLSVVGCYNSSLSSADRDRLMLASAKHNLQFMPFFMLTEYQKVCQMEQLIAIIVTITDNYFNIYRAYYKCSIRSPPRNIIYHMIFH